MVVTRSTKKKDKSVNKKNFVTEKIMKKKKIVDKRSKLINQNIVPISEEDLVAERERKRQLSFEKIINGTDFHIEVYDALSTTYNSKEKLLKELKEMENIHLVTIYGTDYLVNDIIKKAIMLKFIYYTSGMKDNKGWRRMKNSHDNANRGTTVTSMVEYTRKFFDYKESDYSNYLLAVPLGSTKHETVGFIKKLQRGKYDLVHHNPDANAIHDNSDQFFKELSKESRRRGYFLEESNQKELCSAYCWREMFRFVSTSIDYKPFTLPILKNYNKQYKTYL